MIACSGVVAVCGRGGKDGRGGCPFLGVGGLWRVQETETGSETQTGAGRWRVCGIPLVVVSGAGGGRFGGVESGLADRVRKCGLPEGPFGQLRRRAGRLDGAGAAVSAAGGTRRPRWLCAGCCGAVGASSRWQPSGCVLLLRRCRWLDARQGTPQVTFFIFRCSSFAAWSSVLRVCFLC